MEVIDRPVASDALGSLKARYYECKKLRPVIDNCGVALYCGRELFEALQIELTEVCAAEFFKACAKFGDIVGPICPFDPVPTARFHQLTTRIDVLQARVEELMTRK